MSYYGAPAPGGYAPPGYAAPPSYGAPSGYVAPPGPGGYGAARPPAFNPWSAPGWAPRDPTTWAIFQAVDTDRSGNIKLAELVAVRLRIGHSR